MSLFVNGIEITSAVFNDVELQKIIFDNVLVWQKTSLNLEEIAAMLIDYNYTIEQDTIIISSWKQTLNGESSTTALIPESNIPIYLEDGIGKFWPSNKVTDLIIPDNVTVTSNSIDYWFRGDQALTNVYWNHIGIINMAEAYNGCSNLKTPPMCDPNVIDMRNTYAYCGKLSGPAVCGDKVTSMPYTYFYCYNMNGPAACGNNVTSMYHTYDSCRGINTAACGPKVTDMTRTYINCYLQEAVCGPNVVNMSRTYDNCRTLISAACGNKVKNMEWTYDNCHNLRTPACGPNVLNLTGTYENCWYLSNFVCGNNVVNLYRAYKNTSIGGGKAIVIPNKVTNMVSTFEEAYPYGNMYIYSQSITNAENCFANMSVDIPLNIYVPKNSSTMNAFLSSYIFGKYGRNAHWTQSNNGFYYCNDYFTFNDDNRFYLYPVDNVAAARVQNRD